MIGRKTTGELQVNRRMDSTKAHGERDHFLSFTDRAASLAFKNREQSPARGHASFAEFLELAIRKLAPLLDHVGNELVVELADQVKATHIGTKERALYTLLETIVTSGVGLIHMRARMEQIADGRILIVVEAFADTLDVLDKARKKLIEDVTANSGEVSFVTEPRRSGVRVRIPPGDFLVTSRSPATALH